MNIDFAILAAFGAMICWGFGDFFIQKTTRKIGDVEALAFIGIIGIIGLLPFVFRDIGSIFSLSNLLLLVLLGIITFVVAIFNFEALKKGKISVIDIVMEFELPVTVILGFIFFKEIPNLTQFIFIGLIFLGIILIAVKSSSIKSSFKLFEKGVVLAIIAAVGMGFVNFLTAASSKAISPLMAIWVPWVIFTFMCFLVIYWRGDIKNTFSSAGKIKWIVLFMGLFDTAAWFLYAFATLRNELAITTAITESYPAIAMFLGIWINKEKINWHQYLGAGLALISSFVLAFLI